MRRLILAINLIASRCRQDHVAAYAAMSSYFILMSIIPILMILLVCVRYTPITQVDIFHMAMKILPASEEVESIVSYILNEIYGKTSTVLSISILVVLWSSGKGLMAITNGVNTIYHIKETRNYIFSRIRATIYTLLIIVSIVLCMLGLIFGNVIQGILTERYPILNTVTSSLVSLRTLIPVTVLIVVLLMVYTVLPNRKVRITTQIPGAIIATMGWLMFSFGISLYIRYGDLTYTYGSMTILILLLMWMYFCMYSILVGAEINALLEYGVE